MRTTYDPEANAVYIHLTNEELTPGRDSVPCNAPDVELTSIVLDWKEGCLVGIEVLDARERLPADYCSWQKC
jgi:uncharacterized protein YuzE